MKNTAAGNIRAALGKRDVSEVGFVLSIPWRKAARNGCRDASHTASSTQTRPHRGAGGG